MHETTIKFFLADHHSVQCEVAFFLFSYFAENNSSLCTCDLPHIIISIVSESLHCCLGNFYCMNLEPFSDDILLDSIFMCRE